jgi:hypothetical protein
MVVRNPSELFQRLQAERLAAAWRADLPGSTAERVVVALPSFSLDASVYEHYGDRVPPLENRYLYVILRCQQPGTRTVYLSSLPVSEEVVAGYLSLAPIQARPMITRRSALLSADDASHRPLAEKLLDNKRTLDALRSLIGDQQALIEAWNVGAAERELALVLGVPINGTDPSLRRAATKSGGRRLFKAGGIPVPDGVEDVTRVEDISAAIVELLGRDPHLPGVVIKLDDSVAGDGNIVVRLDDTRPRGRADIERLVRASLPDWYVDVLRGGGVVEALVTGEEFRSPSGQGTIRPDGGVEVLSTHDQRLGGSNGQVFEGCSFPAADGYAAEIGRYVAQVGEELGSQGAIGRFGVDFVAIRSDADWHLFALEINLRKGGTTHPFGITRILTGGQYDAQQARFVLRDGTRRYYGATDNLVDANWVGRRPTAVRQSLARAGLTYDPRVCAGVIPHLLDCLVIDGRMGYTAIGRSREEVTDLEDRVATTLHGGEASHSPDLRRLSRTGERSAPW